MQQSLLWLVLFLAAFTALCFHYGYRVPNSFSYRSKAAFIFSIFFLIPTLLSALLLQLSARSRLLRLGIMPHPSVVESVGIATGFFGDDPVWVFKVKDMNPSLGSFYGSQVNRQGWNIVDTTAGDLVLQRGNERMFIGFYDGWVNKDLIYSLDRNLVAQPGNPADAATERPHR